MPEGDTLVRIADVLRQALVGRSITDATGRADVGLHRLVGSNVKAVEARGKHLLIGFDNGLTLHTHLGLHGSWHRYRPGERWRRSASRASVVLATAVATAACLDAPTVELLDTRALAVHPALRDLGPDASAPDFDEQAALRRLRDEANDERPIGDALLDQRIVAGLGNVYRSELCFIERVDPFAPVSELDDDALRRLLATGSRLLRANAGGGRRVTTVTGTPGAMYVFGRAGRPCRRCGTIVASRLSPRRRPVYWCPRCQPAARPGSR